MLNKILNCKFHLRFVINPLIRYYSEHLGGYQGISTVKREVPIIVSLTSYEERFDDLVISIYSLLNQTIKPDKIILWLSDYYELSDIPYDISKFIKNGLEIRFVKDMGSYTKIFYTLKEYSDSIMVTADDDIYYPKDWLEKLYHSYIANSNDIQAHRAHRVSLSGNIILPYSQWYKHVKEETARYDNFLTGVGGVLYPPNCFTNEVLREDVFTKNCPYADDIWLWVMAVLSGRKVRVVKNHIKTLACTNIIRQLGLNKQKTLYSTNKSTNDTQIQNLMSLYGQNIISRLKSST